MKPPLNLLQMLAQAIRDMEEARDSHQKWADYYTAKPEAQNDIVREVESVGDPDYQRVWVAKYDNVLTLLKLIEIASGPAVQMPFTLGQIPTSAGGLVTATRPYFSPAQPHRTVTMPDGSIGCIDCFLGGIVYSQPARPIILPPAGDSDHDIRVDMGHLIGSLTLTK